MADVSSQLAAVADKIKRRIASALAAATEKLAQSILQEGRSDISSAGKFGARWTQGLTADVEGNETSRTITLRHAVPYWKVFQYGALIQGKPLLWIPLPGVSPGERGDFFATSRKGNLLLFKKAGTSIVPLRVGKESVYIPKKFHLVEIARAESQTLGALLKLELAGG